VNAGNLATISGSNFKASRPTKFVVHGFLSTGDENWYTVSCITELQVE
jgi:Lipase